MLRLSFRYQLGLTLIAHRGASAYAPEHNPDEFLHSDLKRSLGRRPAVKDKAGLERRLRGYLRRLQRQPERGRAFFQAPTTRYAA